VRNPSLYPPTSQFYKLKVKANLPFLDKSSRICLVEFEWNEHKNERNIAERSLDFADARFLFDKPILIWTDSRKDYKEQRLIGLGEFNDRVLVLVYTMRQESIYRIISFRRANKNERRKYYSWIKKHEKQD